MHKSSDTLVRMANQIAKFFAVQGEKRAVAGVADHIRKYWEPRMREGIYAHIDAGGEGLEPLALEGLKALRAGTVPPVTPTTPPLKPKSSDGSRPASTAKAEKDGGKGKNGNKAAAR